MANVIDILIAARDQASATIARVQGSMGGLNTVLNAFGGPAGIAAGGLTSISVGAASAIKSVKDLAAQAEHLSNVSQQTGVSVEAIQTVGFAFQREGLTAEDAGQALKFLNKAITDHNPLLAKMGVTSRDTYKAFLQLSDAFRDRADGPNKVTAGLTLLGRAGNVAIQVMNKGAAVFRAAGEEGHRTGEILGTEMVASLTALDNQFDHLNGQIKGLKTTLAADLAPAVSGVLTAVTNLGLQFQKLAIFALAAKLVLSTWPDVFGGVVGSMLGTGDKMSKGDILFQVHQIIDAVKQFKALSDAVSDSSKPRGDKDTPVPGTGMTLAQFREAIGLLERFPNASSAAFGVRGFRANPKLKPDQMVDVPAAVFDSKTRALEDMRRVIDRITDSGNIMFDTLNSGMDALGSGFLGMFESIGVGGDAFFKSVVAGAKGMVNAIYAELARLAAAAVFKFLLNAVTGGVAGFIGPPAPPGLSLSPALSNRAGVPRAGGGNTYIINAIDARDVVMALMSPGGSMRRANDRIAIGAAY